MKQAIIFLSILILLSMSVFGASVMRDIPSKVTPNQIITITLRCVDCTGDYFVAIEETTPSGWVCTPSSSNCNRFIMMTGITSVQYQLKAPEDLGVSTFTGTYQFTDDVQKTLTNTVSIELPPSTPPSTPPETLPLERSSTPPETPPLKILSSEPDSDGDDVPDSSDLCPGTLSGSAVDATGCSSAQRDTDNDGVTDNIDLCPNTEYGSTVDNLGCPLSGTTTTEKTKIPILLILLFILIIGVIGILLFGSKKKGQKENRG